MEKKLSEVIVLSMHRSGSSATTELLTKFGLYFGSEEESIGKNDENTRGFWERRDVRDLNDEILYSIEAEWDAMSKFSITRIPIELKNKFVAKARGIVDAMKRSGKPIVIKEPRLCLTLPLWMEAFNQPLVVFVYRDPSEVASSLERRNGMPLEHGLALWQAYSVSALRASKNLPVFFVNYSELLLRPETIVSNLWAFLCENEVEGLQRPCNSVIQETVCPQLNNNKKNVSVSLSDSDSRLAVSLKNACRNQEFPDLTGYETKGFSEAYEHQLVFHKYIKLKSEKRHFENAIAKRIQKASSAQKDILRLQIDNNKLYVENTKATEPAKERLIKIADLLKLVQEYEFYVSRQKMIDKNRKLTLQDVVRIVKEYIFITLSGSFNPQYYREKHIDINNSKLSPLLHYLMHGWKEGRDPSGNFSTEKYLKANTDVYFNPLYHYIRYGFREGRQLHRTETDEVLLKEGLVKDYLIKTLESKLSNLEAYSSQIGPDEHLHRLENYKASTVTKRYAFYTAITGGYEQAKVPEFFDEEFDYYLFTDDENLKVPEPFVKVVLDKFEIDPTRLARWVKLNPYKLLSNYECVIWVDSNILVKNSLLPYVRKVELSGADIGMYPHPDRDSFAEEVGACRDLAKDSDTEILNQLEIYKNNPNFDEINRSPLIETNVFVANLKGEKTKSLFECWYSELFRLSRRDQLALPYVLSEIKPTLIMLENSRSLIPRFNKKMYEIYKHSSEIAYQRANYLSDAEPISIENHSRYAKLKNLPVTLSIVVPVYNAEKVLVELLSSIDRQTDNLFELVLVNDGSAEPVTKLVNSFNRNGLKVIENKVNQGYTRTVNEGVTASQGDLVVVLNSDTVLPITFVEDIKKFAYDNPSIDAFGPVSNAASWQSVPEIVDPNTGRLAVNALPEGISVDEMASRVKGGEYGPKYIRVNLLNGFCYAVRRDTYNEIGMLDHEKFPKGYGEEDDFFIRLNLNGKSIAIVPSIYVFHYKTQSFTAEEKSENTAIGQKVLHDTYSKELIQRLVKNSSSNPELIKLREKIRSDLY